MFFSPRWRSYFQKTLTRRRCLSIRFEVFVLQLQHAIPSQSIPVKTLRKQAEQNSKPNQCICFPPRHLHQAVSTKLLISGSRIRQTKPVNVKKYDVRNTTIFIPWITSLRKCSSRWNNEAALWLHQQPSFPAWKAHCNALSISLVCCHTSNFKGQVKHFGTKGKDDLKGSYCQSFKFLHACIWSLSGAVWKPLQPLCL